MIKIPPRLLPLSDLTSITGLRIFIPDMSLSGFSLVPYRLFSYYYRISYPFLFYGFCSLRTNDNAFRLVDLYALFFFNRQLTFWRRFFSWWPTIVYCVFYVLLVMIVVCFILYSPEEPRLRIKFHVQFYFIAEIDWLYLHEHFKPG